MMKLIWDRDANFDWDVSRDVRGKQFMGSMFTDFETLLSDRLLSECTRIFPLSFPTIWTTMKSSDTMSACALEEALAFDWKDLFRMVRTLFMRMVSSFFFFFFFFFGYITDLLNL